MTYQAHWISGSPYSWRMLLALEIKGLNYESTLLQASKKEHKSTEFLQLNPRGKVPVLTDGNKAICESIAIIAYLDRKHPEPPLFGTNPEETGLIWQRIFEIESYIYDPVMAIVGPVYFEQITQQMSEIEQAMPRVYSEFKTIDTRLADHDYLSGDNISTADIMFFPVVMSLHRALTLEAGMALKLDFLPFSEHYPNIGHWVKRIEALPGYEKTYPPHWRTA